MSKAFYITTPIYYVNDVPHIGHAYTTIAADVLARHYKQWYHDVFFLTGLDEHGQKVQQAAIQAGINEQTYCDNLAPKFQELWKRLEISNNDFIRTTQKRHTNVVQHVLTTLHKKGEIYKASYTGWYCTFDERFWTAKDIINGLCPDCKRPVEQLSEDNYFFRMSKYQEKLKKYVEEHHDFIQPQSRRLEVMGFLRKPLEDLSISRPKSRLTWGVELPFDPNYVAYVWLDALVNYISIPGYSIDTDRFQKWWPANIHLIGKDILTTHSVYWSTMLIALELPLPKTIFAHGWWTVNGEKMSKSRGNAVDPYAIEKEFGADAFRYFLLREVPFGYDGDYSRNALIGRINSDLADDLGNLLHRTLNMIEMYSNSMIPTRGVDSNLEVSLRQKIGETLAEHKVHLEKFNFHKSLESIWGLVQHCNQYLDKSAPWKLSKDPNDKDKLDAVLHHSAQVLRSLSFMLYPYMPKKAEEMVRQLGINLDISDLSKWQKNEDLGWSPSLSGTRVVKGSPLFPKIDAPKTQGGARVTDTQQPTPPSSQAGPAAAPGGAAPQITIEDFQKIQLKVAKVLTAERVPKSEKLLKLQVDLGTEQRQVVAGIGKKYTPEELIGRRVVIVANLKPAKLMGVESQGMVLAAGDAEVKELVTLMSDVDPGTKVK